MAPCVMLGPQDEIINNFSGKVFNMGMEFTAILRCDATTETVVRGRFSEAMDRPMSLQAVLRCWQESGFFDFHEDWRVPVWVKCENHKAELPARPLLPTLEANLRLPEGFLVTVAKDSIIVYHLLNWHSFLTDSHWQSVMFESVAMVLQGVCRQRLRVGSRLPMGYVRYS